MNLNEEVNSKFYKNFLLKQFLKWLIVISTPFIIVFFCTNCNKCIETYLFTLGFTENDLEINPYQGDETIVFCDTQANTVSFQGNGRYSRELTVPEITDPYKGCRGEYYFMEMNVCGFYSSSNKDFHIYLDFSDYFRTGNKNKIITIGLSIPIEGIGHFYGSFSFDEDTLFVVPPKVTFHDTLDLNNGTYISVYELIGNEIYYSPDEGISTLFYTIKEGIVGYRTNLGRTWNMIVGKRIQIIPFEISD